MTRLREENAQHFQGPRTDTMVSSNGRNQLSGESGTSLAWYDSRRLSRLWATPSALLLTFGKDNLLLFEYSLPN